MERSPARQRSRMHSLAVSALGLSGVLVAGPASAAVVDNLRLYVPYNETDTGSTDVTNAAPGAPVGTRTSTIAINQAGVVGGSYRFDGANEDRVALGDYLATDFQATNRASMTAWVNPTFYRSGTATASRHTIMGASTPLVFTLYGEGNVFFTFQAEGSTTNWSTNTLNANNLAGGMTVPLNQWSHVAATRDGATVRLYINGVLAGQRTDAATTNFYWENSTNYQDGVYTGYHHDTPDRDYDGRMDESALWVDRSLAHQEIALIAGLARLSGVALNDDAIDEVLAVFNASSGVASAGGMEWSYVDSLAAPADASTQWLGSHYIGTDDNAYIILGGSPGAWTGVTAAVPEPASLTLIGLGLVLARRRCSR